MTMALVATLFTFSNFVNAPAATPSISERTTKEELKAKFTNSKAGQLLIKKMEKQIAKRQEKLEKQLSKAEAKNDTKKIIKIKEQQKTKADLGSIGVKLMIVGAIGLVVGLVLVYTLASSIGGLIWSLGSLALAIGFILWLVDMVAN
ncbi:MAG: hypothetical protein EAZ08_05735 [Cytophagales bacterium]|nr:MAG: hypothetical protein EAZ08_05735 [Cytophagales bacterium]